MSERRIGILGGTFDPIHYGHLAIAEDVRTRLELEDVLFVPTGSPPHKQGRPISPAADRVAMVELAIADNPGFRLSRADVDRPGPSYTVDLLRVLQAEHPDARLVFVVGGDSLAELPTWHAPEQLLERCQLVAVNRPGHPPVDLARLESIIPRARERILALSGPELNVSASALRRRVREGRPIRYLVPEAVRAYVEEHGLYRNKSIV